MIVVVHTQIYPGYDKIVARHPRLGALLRALTYGLEATPLRALGLSHLLVVEKSEVLPCRGLEVPGEVLRGARGELRSPGESGKM